MLPSRKARNVRNISKEEQRRKHEEQHFIAMSFIEHGVNFFELTRRYPDMPPKQYRCYIEAVNNQTVNEIIDFLRYECNIQIERMNRDQKRSIRTQLTKIREWLGNKDKEQLETFYQFIRRHYDRSIEISEEAAVKLYKTILCIIKSPHVNLLEEQQQGQNEKDEAEEQSTMLVMEYLRWWNVEKVSDRMFQKYGYELFFSVKGVELRLQQLFSETLDKIYSHLTNEDKDKYGHLFTGDRKTRLEKDKGVELKRKIFEFYLEKNVKYEQVLELTRSIRIKLAWAEGGEKLEKEEVMVVIDDKLRDSQLLTMCGDEDEDEVKLEE